MLRSAALVGGVCLSVLIPSGVFAQEPPSQPPLRAITITGAREISPRTIEESLRVRVGEPLTDTPERLGEAVNRYYRDEGYTFARVKASFDATSGTLTFDIDEGTVDAVVFQGVDEKLARTFADEFALRAGDVFNRRRARQALDVLLRPTRGSVRPGKTYPQTFTDSAELSQRRGTFDLVEINGERTLLVGLRQPAGRFKVVPDLGEREDWFSSVDGFVPSLGMGIAVFDHDRFNHTFVAGHLSYKAASSRVGYALGFERPLFGKTKLFVGGELHDLTASDDQWQLSSLEASLAAVGPRLSYRDYYNRRGVQITGALRLHRQVEALFAWRGERQEPLRVTSDFSFWNSDEAFRPNAGATDGRLNAVLIGASFDGRGFDRESLEATYRRHQFDTLFGERLDGPEGKHDLAPIWRVDWTSELSEADALGSDFDFRRHIVTSRARLALSEHQTFGVRAIGGWSDGVLPPQRQFAVGGFGSVHGYDFKEQVGDTLALLNLEYELGWRGGLRGIGFFDVGRATLRSVPGLPPVAAAPWLKGVGFGIGLGDFRVDFGYKVDDVPSSLRVIVRFGRTF
jgi:Surface antigen variable number repeat